MSTTVHTSPARGRTPRAHRKVASAAGLLLVAALVPLLGPAAPAHAADCQTEVPNPAPPSACDDDTPPETDLGAMSPTPDDRNWITVNDVSFAFTIVSTDPADTDDMKTECKLEGPSQAHDWQDCTSPKTYTDLADTPDGATYTFSVRAYDSEDRAITYDDPQTPPPPIGEPDPEVADVDATPDSISWKQDSQRPTVTVAGGPYDRHGDGWPVAAQPRVSYILSANEDVDYTCQLDGSDVACREGENTFTGLDGGNRTFTVSAEDRAGNPTSSTVFRQFVMPHNLTQSQDWRKARLKGAFAGDVLETRRPGDRVRFRARNIRALTLIAPSGPGLGKIQVRVGNGVWHVVNLARKGADARRNYVIRTSSAPLVSGSIVIESISTRPVRVDALIFPPG